MATLKNLVDETTNIKNELVACHSNLKNNLVAKGVECNNTDKLLNLISKVSNITLESLGGRKWASGTISTTETTYVAQANGVSAYTGVPLLTVSNLDFKPSVIVQYSSTMNLPNFYYVAGLKLDTANKSEVFRFNRRNGSTTYTNDGSFHQYDSNYKCFISENGFGVPASYLATEWLAFE